MAKMLEPERNEVPSHAFRLFLHKIEVGITCVVAELKARERECMCVG